MTAPVGPLAEEAAQLLDVVAERLARMRDRQRRGTAGREQEASAGPADPGAHADPDGPADDREMPDDDVDPGAGDSGDAAAPPGRPGVRCPQCGNDPDATVTCTGCPLCAALALLRGERPETAAKLMDGALAVVQVLRGLLADAGDRHAAAAGERDAASPNAASPGDAGNPSGDGDPEDGTRRGGLVRIDIR